MELRNWLAQEFRLAMQQEGLTGAWSTADRTGVAEVRAARVLAKLDGIHVGTLTDVPEEERVRTYHALVRKED